MVERRRSKQNITYATQRDEDEAASVPLADWMVEDPLKRGVPLFLQTQNRRGREPVARVRSRRVML